MFTSASEHKSNDNNQSLNVTANKSLDDEEKDFFNQKTTKINNDNGNEDGKKLTKESILSLYSQTPTNNNLLNGTGYTATPSSSTNSQFSSNINPLFNPIVASNHHNQVIIIICL